MMKKRFFVYAISSRVLWISEQIFQIPVLNDLYGIYMLEKEPQIAPNECINYTVKTLRNFIQDELVYAPIKPEEQLEIRTYHEKIKIFVLLCDYINYSYLSALPPVFSYEQDRLDVLSRTLINEGTMTDSTYIKHADFVERLMNDKKIALKNKFVQIVADLKKATTPEEVQRIGYEVSFNGIHIA